MSTSTNVQINGAAYCLMYSAVGNSAGSQPIFIVSGSWYTRTQSTFMIDGKIMCSRSTKPKLKDIPRLRMMYCQTLSVSKFLIVVICKMANHGFSRDQSRVYLDSGIRCQARLSHGPGDFPVRYPRDVLMGMSQMINRKMLGNLLHPRIRAYTAHRRQNTHSRCVRMPPDL